MLRRLGEVRPVREAFELQWLTRPTHPLRYEAIMRLTMIPAMSTPQLKS
jgi:hypothetical protein